MTSRFDGQISEAEQAWLRQRFAEAKASGMDDTQALAATRQAFNEGEDG